MLSPGQLEAAMEKAKTAHAEADAADGAAKPTGGDTIFYDALSSVFV